MEDSKSIFIRDFYLRSSPIVDISPSKEEILSTPLGATGGSQVDQEDRYFLHRKFVQYSQPGTVPKYFNLQAPRGLKITHVNFEFGDDIRECFPLLDDVVVTYQLRLKDSVIGSSTKQSSSVVVEEPGSGTQLLEGALFLAQGSGPLKYIEPRWGVWVTSVYQEI
jgi:hypothetical protein